MDVYSHFSFCSSPSPFPSDVNSQPYVKEGSFFSDQSLPQLLQEQEKTKAKIASQSFILSKLNLNIPRLESSIDTQKIQIVASCSNSSQNRLDQVIWENLNSSTKLILEKKQDKEMAPLETKKEEQPSVEKIFPRAKEEEAKPISKKNLNTIQNIRNWIECSFAFSHMDFLFIEKPQPFQTLEETVSRPLIPIEAEIKLNSEDLNTIKKIAKWIKIAWNICTKYTISLINFLDTLRKKIKLLDFTAISANVVVTIQRFCFFDNSKIEHHHHHHYNFYLNGSTQATPLSEGTFRQIPAQNRIPPVA